MDAQSGSRTLGAAHDLVELLRLAQGAAERLGHELYGPQFGPAEVLQGELQRLRRIAERLQKDVERFVSQEESAGVQRGHPLRRAADRSARA
jgi:hypothetical protein